MKGTTVLFEPLPIGRLGVRRDDEEVVLGTDFSSFAYMLEEFVSLAALKIAIPKSFPEVAALSEAPELLKRRITVIDDVAEIEAAERILYPLMKDLEISINSDTGELHKPRDLPRSVFSAVQRIRRDVKCLALGFNHSLHIDLDSKLAASSSRKLREHVQQPDARAILANLEGFFSYYEDLEFDSVTPPPDVPAGMITIFDRLLNDPQYLRLSETVASLSDPRHRRRALSEIRALGRAIMSSNVITTGWNYIAKIIKVWTGVPVPETNTLSILVSNKTLPPLVDLRAARERAVKMWMASAKHDVPCRRSGTPLTEDEVDWLPPCASLQASRPGDSKLSLGTVGELLEILQNFQEGRITSGCK